MDKLVAVKLAFYDALAGCLEDTAEVCCDPELNRLAAQVRQQFHQGNGCVGGTLVDAFWTRLDAVVLNRIGADRRVLFGA